MNYVCPATTPCCISCGIELPFELELDDASGLACNGCFRESEAAMAKAKQSEADSDFRWQSREWFRSPAAAVLRKAVAMYEWDEFEKWNRARAPGEQVD